MTPSPQKVALVTGAARGIGLASQTVSRRGLARALLDIEGELLWNSVERWPPPEIRWGCIATSPTQGGCERRLPKSNGASAARRPRQ